MGRLSETGWETENTNLDPNLKRIQTIRPELPLGHFFKIKSLGGNRVIWAVRPAEWNSRASFTKSTTLVYGTEESTSVRFRRRSRDFTFHWAPLDDNPPNGITCMDSLCTFYHCGRICLC